MNFLPKRNPENKANETVPIRNRRMSWDITDPCREFLSLSLENPDDYTELPQKFTSSFIREDLYETDFTKLSTLLISMLY